MKYLSTRGSQKNLSYNEILLEGLSIDGGLFIPEKLPKFSLSELLEMSKLDYYELASKIIHKFTGDDADIKQLKEICKKTYQRFNGPDIAPLKDIGCNNFILELFHGPTWAFKDYAMQLLASDFERVLSVTNQKSLVLGATSGDTGSAALQAFAGKDNLDIFILFPLLSMLFPSSSTFAKDHFGCVDLKVKMPASASCSCILYKNSLVSQSTY